eukprot:gb/GECG01007238.1/.p1 GENE.gb/GECG01007238.1/~~gb/GECG01007238.1/.p1  ORF type:complete len:198 (+),score=16.72 gb/GECG01007238.1/:1-594(+)
MLRRYLTHRRRAYASVVRKIRAQNLKYLLNEKLKLNQHDAKFILTQPIELAQEAISLHFNATFQMEQDSSPTMLITSAAKVRRKHDDIPHSHWAYLFYYFVQQNDVMHLVKEAFAVSRKIREARSQELVEAMSEGKEDPLGGGPMQTRYVSINKMDETPTHLTLPKYTQYVVCESGIDPKRKGDSGKRCNWGTYRSL